MNNALHDVCQAIGIIPKETPPDNKWYPTDVVNKSPGNGAGRVKRFADDTGGLVWNWLLGDADQCNTYFDNSEVKLNPAEKAERIRRAKEERDRAAKELEAERAVCREQCASAWKDAPGATGEEEYLQRKGVKPHGIRKHNDVLMIPVRSISGITHGMQFIFPDGKKKFKPGTKVKGNFYLIGDGKSQIAVICEGFATGASIREATGYDVYVAFNAGNLAPVAHVLAHI